MSTNKKYIQKGIQLPRSAIEYLEKVSKDHNQDTTKFLIHLINCALYGSGSKEIPIGTRNFIYKHCRKMCLTDLIDHNLVGYIPEDRQARRCREYYLTDAFLGELNKVLKDALIMNEEIIPFPGQKRVSLPKLHRRYDANRKQEPEQIQAALDQLTTSIVRFDREALNQLKEAKSGEDQLKLEMSFNGLELFLKRKHAKEVDKNVFEYPLAYRVGQTGRIFEIGGGVQNRHREIKRICYSLPNIHNYDIRSSLFSCMVCESGKAGICLPAIESYISDKEKKYEYATRSGLTVDGWKEAIYAISFGANIDYLGAGSAFSRIFDNEMARLGICDESGAVAWLKKCDPMMREAMADLKEDIQTWNTFVRKVLIPDLQYNHSGKRYIRNSVGKRLCLDGLGNRKSKKVAAMMLQGLEAGFIHMITRLSSIYDYRVIANEHDGVVTIGQIPKEAIEEARIKSGFINAVLEEKGFF